MWLFLSGAEIDAMWSQVPMSDTKFKDQFHTVYKQIVYELEMQVVSEHKLRSHFMYQTLVEPFLTHDSPLSLVSFRMLSSIIDRRKLAVLYLSVSSRQS